MKIFHKNYYSGVVLESDEEISLFKDFAEKELKGKERDEETGEWVEYRVYQMPSRDFAGILRGLSPRVLRRFKDYVTEYDIYYKGDFYRVRSVSLRDYQIKALHAVQSQIRFCGMATLRAAAGSGKTEVAIALYESLGEPETIYMALSADIIRQSAARFVKYGFDDIGLLDSKCKKIRGNILFTTVQSLYRAILTAKGIEIGERNPLGRYLKKFVYEQERKEEFAEEIIEKLRRAKLIILDECHHAPCEMIQTILYENPEALKFGMSYSPWREDGKDLHMYGLIGDIVPFRVLCSDLQQYGYAVPINVVFIKYERISHYIRTYDGEIEGPDLYYAYKTSTLTDPYRNMIIGYIAKYAKKPILVFVPELWYGEFLKKMFIICFGIENLEYLHGKISSKKRKEIFDRMRNEELDVLIATQIVDEGIDIPSLRSLIITFGGKSSVKVLQRAGRVARPYYGKDSGYIYDFIDMDVEMLKYHALRRYKVYKSERSWKIHVVDGRNLAFKARDEAIRNTGIDNIEYYLFRTAIKMKKGYKYNTPLENATKKYIDGQDFF